MKQKILQRLERIEAVLHSTLPETPCSKWLENSFEYLPSGISAEHFSPLLQTNRDLMLRGGKRWRPLLLVLVAELENTNLKKSYSLTPVIEFIHTASLIHDDIEDNAEQRRGDVAVHLKYGLDVALNSGAWLYFHALSLIKNYDGTASEKDQIYNFTTSTISALHLGQAMDIAWHRNPTYIPSYSEYESMISLKTGALSQLAGQLGIFSATADCKKACKFGEVLKKLGIAFQVFDDIKNITVGNKGKNRGDDIVEGKKSLPIILHVQDCPSDSQKITEYFNRASEEGINSSAVSECIELLHSGIGIKKAEEYANGHLLSVIKEVRELYASTKASEELIEFIEYLNRA